MSPPLWSVTAAIAAMSGAVMLFEVALMRIFSFRIWHHFAFMVVSVALLGFGVSGVLLQLWPRLGVEARRSAAACATLFGLTGMGAVWLVTQVPFNPVRFAQEPVQLAYLFAHYAVLVVPFTFAGLALLALLRGFAGAAGRLYASDLMGAALGCLAFVPLIGWVGAEGVVVLAAAVACASGWLLLRDAGAGRPSLMGGLALTGALVVAVPLAPRLYAIPPGPGKGLQLALDARRFPEARLVSTAWHALSRVDVVEGTGTVTWTRNPRSPAPSPPQTQIVIDGDAAAPIVSVDGASLAFLDYTLSSAALQAFSPGRVLVIGAGGGVDVLTALHHRARHVDAVEINPIIVDLVTGRYAERSGGLFRRPEVALHVGEGRSFLHRRPDRYDLIQLSMIDTFAASASGAYSLSEGYLYTVEAFGEYLGHLSDHGVLTLTRWRWSPPREILKLCTVAVAALQRLGVRSAAEHIVVLALGPLGNLLVKRTPFTAADLERLAAVASDRGFGVLYAPGVAGDNPFVSLLTSSDPSGFLAGYPYDITPATDERPFFFQFGRWRDANPFGAGWRDSPLVLSGRLVLLAVLAQAAVLSLLLLVGPVVYGLRDGRAGRPPGPPTAGAVAYFFLIGVSFMLLEITLMQRLTLYLGHPIYAITLVLAVLLLSAGAGSGLAPWMLRRWPRPWPVFLAIGALALGYAVSLPAAFGAALALPLAGRLAFATVLLAPMGFLLGVPFPAAVARLASAGATPMISAAWAANGCGSVVGPVVAVLLAIDMGFPTVMAVAAVGYLAAYLAFAGWWAVPGAAATAA